MKTITQKEIARRAGVSQTAASMVLSGRQNAAISDETRRKILSVARKSGYRMRFVRQAYTQTRTIAYLLDMKSMDTDVSQAYYQRFIGTLSQTLDDSGYSLAVVSHTTVERSIDTVIERKFDGIISEEISPLS